MTDDGAPQQDKRFYAKDVHQLNLVLGKFLQRSRAENVLLVDEAGHLVARQGAVPPANEETLAALVAGTYAAARAMAEMLGTDEYSSMIPCNDGRNLLVLRAGDHALVGVAFSHDASVPLVRTYALEAIRRIAEIIRRADQGGAGAPDEHIQGKKFDSEIGEALTDVFG